MKFKKFLCGLAIFFAAAYAFSVSSASREAPAPSKAEPLETQFPPLPTCQAIFLENAENIFFESEQVSLDAAGLTGTRCRVKTKSVSRLKNSGEAAVVKMGVPFCGQAKSSPEIAVKTDGKEAAGRIAYGGLYVRQAGEFPQVDAAEPRAEGGGTLYVFDTTACASFTYAVACEPTKPLFHGGCNGYETNETSFTAVLDGVGDEYELFVGGISEIETANAAYTRREMTCDEYFERSYSRLLAELSASGDGDALSAPREYHYARYAAAVAQGKKRDVAEFYLNNDQQETAMLYTFDFAMSAGAEAVLEIEQESDAMADVYFEPYKWNYEYRNAVSSPHFSFTVSVFESCPYLLSNGLPFQKTENGYECVLDSAPERLRIALCAEENPRYLYETQRQKKPDKRKIILLTVAAVLFCCGILILVIGFKGERKK